VQRERSGNGKPLSFIMRLLLRRGRARAMNDEGPERIMSRDIVGLKVWNEWR
jgi:hypothetical protein